MGKDYDPSYLNKQFAAMRWLAVQGLTPEEIREMRWGAVDETTKKIKLRQTFFSIKYDLKTRAMIKDEYDREILIDIEGSGNEWFFLKSMFKCPWMFTSHPPKTWRKEGSKEALFPLDIIERNVKELLIKDSTRGLTFSELFDNIEISKLNITNSKPEEIREAKVVKN